MGEEEYLCKHDIYVSFAVAVYVNFVHFIYWQ